MAKKAESTLEVKPCNYEELLAEAKAAEGVTVTEIDPCQSVTIEAKGAPVEAFLVVRGYGGTFAGQGQKAPELATSV